MYAGADDILQNCAAEFGSPLAESGGQGERLGGSRGDADVMGVRNCERGGGRGCAPEEENVYRLICLAK